MNTNKVLKTIALVSAFAVAAGSAHAGGLLGGNYVGGTTGSTIYDSGANFGTFDARGFELTNPNDPTESAIFGGARGQGINLDSREYSFDAGLHGNLNIHPNFDLNLAYSYSRLSGNANVTVPDIDNAAFADPAGVIPGMQDSASIRLRTHNIWLRGIAHAEAVSGVTPYVSGGIGWIYRRERGDIGDSDNAFQFAVGSGVEFAFLQNTALRLGGEWRHVGKTEHSTGPFELVIPRQQQVVWQGQVSHRINPDVSVLAKWEHQNTTNNTQFLVGANWHIDGLMR
jgi:opacity protein-like surface antigen